MLIRRLYFLILCFWSSFCICPAQVPSYKSFDNINLSATESAVNCFVQDSRGLIWVGTGDGLYSYDGYQALPHYSSENNTATRLYCGVMVSEELLYVGGDNGIHIYNIPKGRYEPCSCQFPSDVRSLLYFEGQLWIGSLNGLYCYDPQSGKLENAGGKNIPHQAVYSVIGLGRKIYVGTYNGMCSYDLSTKRFETIALPVYAHRSNCFVNSLCTDGQRECIWIGTEGGLFKHNVPDGSLETIRTLDDNSIKSLALDLAGNLLLGTDNGFYVYNPLDGRVRHIVHDSRNSRSLSNNIIWNVFRDNKGNIWLGTDNGISLAPNNTTAQFIPISDITGIGDGNQFYAIYRDSRGLLWMGGTNGLIRHQTDPVSGENHSTWYRMGDKEYPMSHNRIRDIYEDQEHNLWVATDGSINRYDYDRRQFVRYSVVDGSRVRNANWAYKIFEDHDGRMWIATYLGGIFGVQKSKLLASAGSYCIAEYNLVTADGLPSDAVNNIVPDNLGNIWSQSYPNGLFRLDVSAGEIHKITIRDEGSANSQANSLTRDSEGYVWAGLKGATVRIDPASGEQKKITFDSESLGTILSMCDSERYMWLSSTSGVFAIGKDSLEVHRIRLAEKSYTSVYYDHQNDRIYLGTTDGIIYFSEQIVNRITNFAPLYISAVYVNNKLLSTQESSVSYSDGIKLNYHQNNISFSITDLNYLAEGVSRFIYRLEGFDNEWNSIDENNNRISYTNLPYGTYKLLVRTLGSDNRPWDSGIDFAVRITPPWYWTALAKVAYFLITLGLIAWIINFFRVRSKLRTERLKREQSLELSNLKMDFFTNVSHEFKTPLSLIIAPVGKMLAETKTEPEKHQLELIQRNAIKLNSLIHRILEFNRTDASLDSGVILSRVEFVAFARSLFSVYEEAMKNLNFEFTTHCDQIHIETDILKTESILNNLLSNACKYTQDGGRIKFDIECSHTTLTLRISDTGLGIPRNEQPYIFGRFFQSSTTAKLNKGTGVGLYIVRKYTELQGGTIEVESTENQGSLFTVTLPVTGLTHAKDNLLRSPEDATTDPTKPLMLIVEDNPEISCLISQICGSYYRTTTAENGKIGLEKCLKLNPDLVISDIMMPVMDGLEMCRKIRSNTPLATLPIILLTAKDDKETQIRSMELNINAFIPKPFDPDLLLSRIGQLLQNKVQMRTQARIETITAPTPIAAVSYDEKFLVDLTELIERNVAEADLSVSGLSNQMHINEKQMYRKVKQLTGMTPVDFIRSIRLKKAAMLLEQKKFSVSEVMYMVGFSNSSYFSKCFQKEFGLTPRQYISKPE